MVKKNLLYRLGEIPTIRLKHESTRSSLLISNSHIKKTSLFEREKCEFQLLEPCQLNATGNAVGNCDKESEWTLTHLRMQFGFILN